ncbi:MAG TPA: S1 RNA-binding domain-containing protein, partial [Acidimicrobiales bacterium]|nr:S1 RNA-binding domain-containing protein [Acidimicrobiales bacterium]
MPARRVVVDGSNIATEGRTTPSLSQLNEAVLAFLNEYPDSEVTVVVDATFGHRIDQSEVPDFEAAEANNELVSPPAGAIGRGDAFLLRIAGKIGATVLSNDSFQEFHGEHDWLFDEGRLIGGKPVQGIGWIFTPRTPVRGAKSRKAVKDAKQRGRGPAPAATSSGEALGPAPVPTKPPPRARRSGRVEAPADGADIADAIAVATAESVTGEEANGRKRRRKKRGARPAEPVNDSLPFITFIAEHPLGSEVEGEVETFTSHGAFVVAGGARCYVPISALGDPPPRAARDVLTRGGRRMFVVQALDPQRRGIELALPEFARVAGAPRQETIEAEISEAPGAAGPAAAAELRGRRPASARAGTAPSGRAAPGGTGAGQPSRRRSAGTAAEQPVGAPGGGAGPAPATAATGETSVKAGRRSARPAAAAAVGGEGGASAKAARATKAGAPAPAPAAAGTTTRSAKVPGKAAPPASVAPAPVAEGRGEALGASPAAQKAVPAAG